MSQTNNFLFKSLNNEQLQAVKHVYGPLLVVAGAGSGKTKALTHRIANLIENNSIDPYNILAVTFTNKAAKEMKARLEVLLAQELAFNQFGQPWTTLEEIDQNQLRTNVHQERLQNLWIGTFHSLFSRLLRYDIEKYTDPEGLKWTRQFSIYDETDSQTLVKEIISQDMNLDPKRYDPKKIKRLISNAKNQCLTSNDLSEKADNNFDKTVAEAYKRYRISLSKNNSLDFDDLLLLPVFLLRQNDIVRDYWHKRFKHILVDEYQDTNRTQYELIKLITAGNTEPKKFFNWEDRSIFVVGDADQSIYSFRAADFRILIGFQEDFKTSINDGTKSSLIKLEENYRSSSNILDAANSLIENNSERIDKVLKATKEKGELLTLLSCDDEISEAEAITNKIKSLNNYNQNPIWKNFAILYRTRAQSRVLEESLVRWRIPYTIFGGLRFYDRREIKDAIAYLKVLVNSSDNVSLLRIINVPRRGIGKTTIQKLNELSNRLNIPLWEVLNDKQSLEETIGRSSKGINKFTEIMNDLLCYLENSGPAQLLQLILEKSGYLSDLLSSGTEESEDRRNNLQELINAATQYEEETESGDVEGFLSTAALTTDNDTKKNNPNSVTLMTLHNSKGLEFQNVFITGLEQGLFPSHRSIDTPSLLEEERRLCYVGITRAKERVFLSHARERRLWGGMREATIPSIFLSEIPEDLMYGELPQTGGASIRRDWHLDRLTRVDRNNTNEFVNKPINAVRKLYSGPSKGKSWIVGDMLIHSKFGKGEIIHIFGSGEKISLAVKFGDKGSKILDPRLAPIRYVS
ncbi:ATP-dependent DNA helicase UvrD/PcrA [Prochlorococcus marinus str. MIT 9201]|uniref:DNA 3'-5' helicase n=1 Tax=Prochlorococcus marinus str. MIT 9201 TaxID=93057 RepID=A0A0A1ZYR7_PROMR|nr:UvrD-helicase domain-containing protein [Prochlorococcus marinus]KGF94475.1 ATP-dependent DNA helicase UvrD/PcrA [Prochlorococcus marinus str. MIT 9201]